MAKKVAAAQPYTRKHTLVYLSRLTSDDKVSIFRLSDLLITPSLRTNFDGCWRDVMVDRLARAEQCLALAKRLTRSFEGKPASEESLRGAVGRAYYSAHHSIRVLAMHENRYDPDGHADSIDALADLLQSNSFRAKSRLTPKTAEKVREAYDNRCVADYSPYDMSIESGQGWVFITGNTWPKAAKFNINWAGKLFQAALKVVS